MLLTRQFFAKGISPKRVMKFIIGLYYSKKIAELVSFLFWEIKYRLSLYPRDKLLNFGNRQALLSLGTEGVQSQIISDGFKITESRYNWGLVFFDDQQNLWACLCGEERALYRMEPGEEPRRLYVFPEAIRGIFVTKAGNVFVCTAGNVFRSADGGSSFEHVLIFSCHQSFFRHETITESPEGTLFIGEYANVWQELKCRFVGFIYHSVDGGKTWHKSDFLKRAGVNKHVHVLRWSRLLNGLVLTDGDNKKYLWINHSPMQPGSQADLAGHGWKKINRFHIQKGGYTALAEAGGILFLGTDYYGGTNFLVTTSDMKTFTEKVIPDPYRRGFVRRMVLRTDGLPVPEIWANLKFNFSKGYKSLLMVTNDLGRNWQKVIEYDGSRFGVKIISDSKGTTNEHFLLVQNKKTKTRTTLRIHS